MQKASLTDGNKIVLNKHDIIGVDDALDDKKYLLNCFVDLGDLDQIKDFESKKCLLLGRTGAGKTALVTKLQDDKKNKVIVIDPEAVAMAHISNSSIVSSLVASGIDLNTFFKMLWRHEICVEIFARHLKITSETEYENIVEKIKYYFKTRNTKHFQALEYLEQWRDTFWKTNDSYISKVIEEQKDKIEASVGADIPTMATKLKAGTQLTQQQVIDFKQRSQEIVNSVQIREVTALLEMLDEFINYNQGKYYVIIDRLDEKWVGNDIRYQLIKSLIETLRDLNRLDNIKPIATLRYDLLGRVFDVSRDSGFQEEKYQPLYLDIRWTQSQLIDLLNSRINFQFRLRYQKKTKLTYTDIFPDRVNNIPIISFLLERTMMRPRDVIELVNFCIRRATEKEAEGFITERVVIDAEREYSKNRLRSLYYEWFVDYPGLEKLITLLRQKPSSFPLRDMADAEIENLCLDYVANPPKPDVDSNDPIFCLVEGVVKGESIYEFKKVITKIFYRVGLLGIRDCPDSDIRWSDSVYSSVDISDIEQDSMLCVHKCYWSALRIQDI
jgi:ATPase involved in DNA repair